jgi:hypothetical protein
VNPAAWRNGGKAIQWAAIVGTAAFLLGRSASGSLLVAEAAGVTLAAAGYFVRRARANGADHSAADRMPVRKNAASITVRADHGIRGFDQLRPAAKISS